jgi:prevent-host-death family protein
MTMKTMSVTKFKAECLEVIREVNESGEEVILTKHGKPQAKLTPVVAEKPARYKAGTYEDKVVILGDLTIGFPEEWPEEE